MEWVDMFIWGVVIGWIINLITTVVSTLNDIYWENQQVSQGIIACMAFSWLPYLVFLAGLGHLARWAFGRTREE